LFFSRQRVHVLSYTNIADFSSCMFMCSYRVSYGSPTRKGIANFSTYHSSSYKGYRIVKKYTNYM